MGFQTGQKNFNLVITEPVWSVMSSVQNKH